MNWLLDELLTFGNYFVDFTFSNPALYAALFIPTCVNTTFHLSTKGRNFGQNIRVWVDISAQIGSVVALAFANIIPLIILCLNNMDALSIKIFTLAVGLFYLYFVRGFVISATQYEEYKSRLGFGLPPWGNRITQARVFGAVVELLLPAYVYMMITYFAVGRFEVPPVLSSLRI